MSRRDLPSGYRAVYQGRPYVASGGQRGEVTLFDPGTRHEVAKVPIADLDEWYTIRTVGTFVGEPFQVKAEMDDGMYWIDFVGGNGHKIADEWAARKEAGASGSYWQEDRYTFMATVPTSEVHDVHEVREDVLGPWREAQEKV